MGICQLVVLTLLELGDWPRPLAAHINIQILAVHMHRIWVARHYTVSLVKKAVSSRYADEAAYSRFPNAASRAG
jgi:hypothetical protein